MELIATILPYAQIILSVVLVTAILIQQSGAGLGVHSEEVMVMHFIIHVEVLKNFFLLYPLFVEFFNFVRFFDYYNKSKNLKTISALNFSFMENFYNRIRNLLPSINEIKSHLSLLSKRVFHFLGLIVILCISTLIILQNINKSFMVNVPMNGGSITEGIAGTPRFINWYWHFLMLTKIWATYLFGFNEKNPDGSLYSRFSREIRSIERWFDIYFYFKKNKIYFHDENLLLLMT